MHVLQPTAVHSSATRVVALRPTAVTGVKRPLWPMLPAMPELARAESVGAMLLRVAATAVPLAVVLGIATFLRFWQLSRVGFNSDEAVYAGTAASMAGHPQFSGMFPIFRAHPLMFQTLLSLFYGAHVGDWPARALAAGCGVATVGVTFLLGRRLYGPVAGMIAALLLAVMPYHVVVSRQVLLDGPMTLLAVIVLYCVVRYCDSGSARWLIAAGSAMGITVLSKETSLILLGGLYAFFALTPAVRLWIRHVLPALGVMAALVAVFPLVLQRSGHAGTGQSYFLWQLSRRPNHPTSFYLHVLLSSVGVLTIAAAVFGLIWLRQENSWRERLLVAWILIPAGFFTLWPLKGFQYLLPVAPALAVLAGRCLAAVEAIPALQGRQQVPLRRAAMVVPALALAGVLSVASWGLVNPSTSGTFLAGTGGVPGGREAGRWLAGHAPQGSQLLAIGPSMANILEFYGQRRAYGLSVSANPRDRNPAYQPVGNPDLWVRTGQVQYVVWDSYTAARTPFFAAKIRGLVDKYRGVAVFTSTVTQRSASGASTVKPVVIVYQVWSP